MPLYTGHILLDILSATQTCLIPNSASCTLASLELLLLQYCHLNKIHRMAQVWTSSTAFIQTHGHICFHCSSFHPHCYYPNFSKSWPQQIPSHWFSFLALRGLPEDLENTLGSHRQKFRFNRPGFFFHVRAISFPYPYVMKWHLYLIQLFS